MVSMNEGFVTKVKLVARSPDPNEEETSSEDSESEQADVATCSATDSPHCSPPPSCSDRVTDPAVCAHESRQAATSTPKQCFIS
jgi:hypothetical protein